MLFPIPSSKNLFCLSNSIILLSITILFAYPNTFKFFRLINFDIFDVPVYLIFFGLLVFLFIENTISPN